MAQNNATAAAFSHDNTIPWLVGGALALYMFNRVDSWFGGDDEEKAWAAVFDDQQQLPEVWVPNAFDIWLDHDTLTPTEYASLQQRQGPILEAVKKWASYRGFWNDDEQAAVGAWTGLNNYLEVIFASEVFAKTFGTVVGDYASNLGDREKAIIAQSIVNKRNTFRD